MTDQVVHYAMDARGVVRVTLNRPEKRNAFSGEIIRQLEQAFNKAAGDPACRVLVLAGEGKHFSAGADLNYMQHSATLTPEENREDARSLAAMLQALDTLPKPTIARVQGAVYGGAVGLVCACDVAIASDDARFCLSEARLGLAPAAIGPYVVRVLGERQARRYFLTSEEISASGAEAFGLVHDVTSRESLDGVIDILIQRLLGNGPNALTACKELIARCGQSAPDTDLAEYTADLIADLRTGTEGQEGLKAFLEKRKASWVQE
ncbi:MAG TPA: enoyl-CoA hydratase [Marinobacter sp.]|nr:enoyl-CoA hydratase [Marinobacter sp.]